MTLSTRPLEAGEAAGAARRAALSFGSQPDEELVEQWRARIASGQVIGAVDDGEVLGHCRVTAVDHWFGGRRVPTQHIASVAVPPEHRGRGVASALMRALIIDGQRAGLGLSLLFPATTRLYRKLGWEHAGALQSYRLDARRATVGGPVMRAVDGDGDWAAILACYERCARATTAAAVRDDELWQRRREAPYAYVLPGATAGTVDAYVLFAHAHAPGDWQYTIQVEDWAATTADGLRAVVGLVAAHGTVGKDARFRDGVPDRWSLLLGEPDVRPDGGMFWMARGLDLPTAIACRGFPPGLSGTATLAVDDPLLDAASGPWRLEVAAGEGRLTPAADAEVMLDARAVGPLFTGFRSPAELAVAGVLLRGSQEALAWLTGAFAGPPPTLVDFF
ncbi:MAG: GNAT family N-acetyltransferase [Euzebyaceae bacterium]|nr:GNAT family N-acetyltransferase [Euzebyaceae bacterium]